MSTAWGTTGINQCITHTYLVPGIIRNFLKKDSIDFVFSQAAFEHFENIYQTFEQISVITKPGAIMIAVVDLKTHSRWIRDRDPNNI